MLSLIFGYLNFSSSEQPADALMSINKRVISKQEFDRHFSKIYSKDRAELMDTLVTQELLIQEAQRMGVDKTDTFRRTIQDFYEQTLVKQTIDKKLSTTPITITDNEIDHYLVFQEQKLHLTFFTAENEAAASKGQLKQGETKVVRGKDLSEDLSSHIQRLKVGGSTAPIGSGSDCIVIRLDKVENGTVQSVPAAAKEALRKMLTEQKKNAIINTWIAELRKKAVINSAQ